MRLLKLVVAMVKSIALGSWLDWYGGYLMRQRMRLARKRNKILFAIVRNEARFVGWTLQVRPYLARVGESADLRKAIGRSPRQRRNVHPPVTDFRCVRCGRSFPRDDPFSDLDPKNDSRILNPRGDLVCFDEDTCNARAAERTQIL